MDFTGLAWLLGLGLAGALVGLALAFRSGGAGKPSNEPEAAARRRLRLQLGVVGAVAGVLLAQLIHPLRSHQVFKNANAVLDAELGKLLEQGSLRDKLIARSRADALLELRLRLPSSAQYLSARDLELWADVRLRIARASPLACAKLWSGGENPAASGALDGFSAREQRDWAEMSARGLALSLEGRPPPAVAPDAIARGFAAVAERLPAAERHAFEADARQPQLDDTRACQLFLQLFAGALDLPQPQRTELLRALAALSAPPPPVFVAPNAP